VGGGRGGGGEWGEEGTGRGEEQGEEGSGERMGAGRGEGDWLAHVDCSLV